MIEWIVLIWWTTFQQTAGGKPQVFISSSTTAFSEQWDRLNETEKKASRIFKGNEFTTVQNLVKKPYSANSICGDPAPDDAHQADSEIVCIRPHGHTGNHTTHRAHINEPEICGYDWP